MRLSPRVWPIIASLGFCASPLAASADQILVGNLNEAVSNTSPQQIDPLDTAAQEFSSAVSVNLVSIQASLGYIDLGTNNDFALTAQLWEVSSMGSNPYQGALIATLSQNASTPLDPDGYSNVEFDPTGTVSLDATKYYWFVLSGTSSTPDTPPNDTGSVQWQYTDSSDHYGSGSLPNYGVLSSGYTWNIQPGEPYLIQVTGSGVPEPSSLILGCIGLTSALLARRWISFLRIA